MSQTAYTTITSSGVALNTGLTLSDLTIKVMDSSLVIKTKHTHVTAQMSKNEVVKLINQLNALINPKG